MNTLFTGYLSLALTIAALLIIFYNYALTKTKTKTGLRLKKVGLASLVIICWFSYCYLIGLSGFLKDFSLPPRFPILLILPLFLFTGIVFSRYKDSAILKVIPPSWPIYFQSFRILVELLFVGSVSIGYLHPEVTIEGYNFDMIFAFTAIPVALYIGFNKGSSKKLIRFWNYLGLTVLASIILLFTTTGFAPHLWGSSESLIPKQMMEFPYLLVAGFLMPVAVFVHIFSLTQTKHLQ